MRNHTFSKREERTHPQPLETPVGVTRTSAKRTSPAANQKLPINILFQVVQTSINKKQQKRATPRAPPHLIRATSTAARPQYQNQAPDNRRGLLERREGSPDKAYTRPLGPRYHEKIHTTQRLVTDTQTAPSGSQSPKPAPKPSNQRLPHSKSARKTTRDLMQNGSPTHLPS